MIMSAYEEYMNQDKSSNGSNHYDVHTDIWVDEGHLPYGHSGHNDSHTDEPNW